MSAVETSLFFVMLWLGICGLFWITNEHTDKRCDKLEKLLKEKEEEK